MIQPSVMVLLVQINHEHQGETVTRWGLTSDSSCYLHHVYILLQKM